MTESFDVIVAGVGSMGAAACHHLARRGARVLGLEQFDIPHDRGSHHGHSRMIRQAYYEHPDYVPLLRRAYELWDRLEADCGVRLLHRTGGLYLGPPDGEIVPGSLASARAHGLPHELLDADALRARFPGFRVPGHFVGFFENEAGLLLPELAVAAHAEIAMRQGAVVRAREPILSWKLSGDGVVVHTPRGEARAARLVVTAGAWTGRLVRELGIELSVTRQVLAWFDPGRDRGAFALDRFPCWFIETETPFGHYGFPVLDGQPGLKIAVHRPGEPIDPDALRHEDTAPRPDEIDALRGVLETFLPGTGGSLLAARTCLYTNSPDHHFIVDRHPGLDPVVLACGFSGHGFKFASVIGEALADLALDGRTDLPVAFLGLGRFS